MKRVALYWPKDAHDSPNRAALAGVEAATGQLEAALHALGAQACRVPDFVAAPQEAIRKLGSIDDPMIGVFTHWCFAPHTTDGVVGRESPLLCS